MVDADVAIGDNKHTDEESDMLLRKNDPIDDTKEKMHGLRADAVGGGNREGITKESSLVHYTISLIDFLTNF